MRSDRNREAGVFHNYYPNNTFKGIRIVSEEYSLYYSVWCTNETEFFDLLVRSPPCFEVAKADSKRPIRIKPRTSSLWTMQALPTRLLVVFWEMF